MKKALWMGASILFFFFLLVVTGEEQGYGNKASEVSAVQASGLVKVERDFGRMPLYFIANRGQMDGRVAYYVQGKDKTIYFTSEGLTIALTRQQESGRSGSKERLAGKDRESGRRESLLSLRPGREGTSVPSERWVVKLDFVGASAEVRPEGTEETGAVISYFKGKPEEWKTGLPTYSKVVYRELWPGIDLVYSGTVNRLKYEFVVHPGADPGKIRLAYRGATDVRVNEEGRLEVRTPLGGFEDDVPVAWQEVEGKRVEVSLSYKLEAGERNEDGGRQGEERVKEAGQNGQPSALAEENEPSVYGFKLGEYDRTHDLIIDPAVLVYCGYIGGSDLEGGNSVAVDGSGNVYVTGGTYSDEFWESFPATVGPDLTFNGGTGDAFVTKVNASGTALVYCGYIGGSGNDNGLGIAVDGSGNAYVTGQTSSTEETFPVAVGPDTTHNGRSEAFVAKVNSAGTGLVYCGYIGGSGDDLGSEIAVDGSGNAYVIGHTPSTEATFPVAVGPDLTHNGYEDVFVAKVNTSGTGLVYCGYIGGGSDDYSEDIAVDGSGNAYVIGLTKSTEATFPVAVGPDLIYNGGWDVFVAKVNASGSGLVYCGYIGGSGDETSLERHRYGIAVDGSGNAYVTGDTYSTEATFPVTVGPDLTYNGGLDVFVAKVNASGSALVYCGYIGGSNIDEGYSIAVDGSGNAYVAGDTYSTEATFPVNVGPDLTHNGGDDVFVAKVNASGTGLLYCGYIGGASYECGWGIAVDGSGNAYVAGDTYSTEATFPVNVGPDLTYNGGWGDAFVVKISPQWCYPVFDGHDFNGNGTSDISVWRPTDGMWYIKEITTQQWGTSGDTPCNGDYNGDGITDIAVWRPSNGMWYIRNIGAYQWGASGDIPVPGDYNGDGVREIAVWRPSNGMWYIYRIGSYQWGTAGDIPVPADYNGDGVTDIAVWRPSNGMWYIRNIGAYQWGTSGDIPAPGKYNLDASADIAVWRPSTGMWYIYNIGAYQWGTSGDIPLVR